MFRDSGRSCVYLSYCTCVRAREDLYAYTCIFVVHLLWKKPRERERQRDREMSPDKRWCGTNKEGYDEKFNTSNCWLILSRYKCLDCSTNSHDTRPRNNHTLQFIMSSAVMWQPGCVRQSLPANEIPSHLMAQSKNIFHYFFPSHISENSSDLVFVTRHSWMVGSTDISNSAIYSRIHWMMNVMQFCGTGDTCSENLCSSLPLSFSCFRLRKDWKQNLPSCQALHKPLNYIIKIYFS